MKKTAMIVAAAGILGFAGTALAHHKTGHDQGQGNAHGAIGCESPSGSGDNPGAWFQSLRNSDKFEGLNPKQIVDHEDVSQESVAELIATYCGQPD